MSKLGFLTESTRDFTETPTIGGFNNGSGKNDFDSIFQEAYESFMGENVDVMVDINTMLKNKAVLESFKDALLNNLENLFILYSFLVSLLIIYY